MNNCTNCRFSTYEMSEKIHYCKRFPPTVFVIPQPGSMQKVSTFPPVSRLVWCGEHKMKVAAIENPVVSDT